MVLENGSIYYISKDNERIKFKLIVEAPNNSPFFIKPPVREIIVDINKEQNQNLYFTLPMINDVDSNDTVSLSLE